MRLTWKDAVATLLFAAIVVPYAGYLAWGSMPFIQDPTGMAGVGLILGAIAAYVGGWIVVRAGNAVRYLTATLGLVSLALGLLALAGENLFSSTVWEYILGGFIAGIVLLWGIAIGRHSGLDSGQTQAPSGLATA
jgi:hypothetical protein